MYQWWWIKGFHSSWFRSNFSVVCFHRVLPWRWNKDFYCIRCMFSALVEWHARSVRAHCPWVMAQVWRRNGDVNVIAPIATRMTSQMQRFGRFRFRMITRQKSTWNFQPTHPCDPLMHAGGRELDYEWQQPASVASYSVHPLQCAHGLPASAALSANLTDDDIWESVSLAGINSLRALPGRKWIQKHRAWFLFFS